MQNILKNKGFRIILIIFGCVMGLWGAAQFYDSLGIGREVDTKQISIEKLQDSAKKSVEILALYENKSLGFRLQYPKNWETGEQDSLPFFKMPEGGVNVVYSSDILTEDATVNELIPELKNNLSASYQARKIPFTIVKEGATLMGSAPAYEWKIESVREGKQAFSTQIWSIKNKKVHILTFSTIANDLHEMFYPTFMKIVQTFEPL